jgi:DNA-binding NtrC family response regulator
VGSEELGLRDESLQNLAVALSQFGSTEARNGSGHGDWPSNSAPTDLDGLERRAILDALEETRGHRQRAAERLGISRRTLSRKLKSYGFGEKMA